MRSHCAIYVDVGYLLASAATRVTGTSLRRGVQVDHPELIRGLIECAEADSGLPLLRVNWYDSGARPGGMPDFVQDEIGLLPRVKLRLGRLSHAGEQKGVDLRIGLDLATHGRNRVVDVIYLVSGDDDLTEAVEEAQGHGVQVILLAVPGPDDRPHGVARHLQRAADGLVLLDAAMIDRAVRTRAIPESLIPDVLKEGEDAAALVPGSNGTGSNGAGSDGAGSGGTGSNGASSSAVGPDGAAPDGAGPDGLAKPSIPGGSDAATPDQATPDQASTDQASREEAGPRRAAATEAGPGRVPTEPAEETPPKQTHAEQPHTEQSRPPDTDALDAPDAARPAQPQADPARSGAAPASAGPTSHAPEPTDDVGAAAPEPDHAPSPTPSLFAKKKATALLPPPEPVGPAAGLGGAGGSGAPDPAIVDTVARQVIRSWCTTATPQMLAELKDSRPSIPGDLDRAMLVDLSNRSGHYDIDEASRHELRSRFWQLVDQIRLS